MPGPYAAGADSISARKACHCRRRPRATNGRPYNALFRQSDLPLRGRCPEGAEGENLAMARNIPARRTVLSPTACGRSPLAEGAKGDARFFDYLRRIFFSFALSKTVIYGILFFCKSTGKPGANRRRKAIGAHRVSQLPTRNCCFYCRPQLRVLFRAGVDEGESTAIHRRHKAGHL